MPRATVAMNSGVICTDGDGEGVGRDGPGIGCVLSEKVRRWRPGPFVDVVGGLTREEMGISERERGR